MMRILHVYKDFCPPVHGGMERHIALNCRFQRQWADVEALTCSRSFRTQRLTRDGTRVTEVGEWGRFQNAPVAPTFPYHLWKANADIIVIHVPNPTAVVAYLISRPRGRLVIRYHSDIVRQATALRFYRPIQMKFLRKAAMILPTSEQYVDTSPALREVRERCRVVPMAILPEEFENPEPARVEALRAQYGGDFVLFSGRHRYYKGLEYLVRAAAGIRARVVIAGDGPERDRCMALARELGVAVDFPGTLTHQELVNHLHACEVFAFPSVERSEAFGISVLEAQACGKPVVATTLGTGIEHANLAGKTGLNVPPRDPETLAQAVNALLDDPEKRRRMGAFARSRVVKEFHAEHVARSEFELYEQVLSGAENHA